jgi:PAS domain S-box-containing protein
VTGERAPRPRLAGDPGVYQALIESIPAIFYIDEPDQRSTNFYTSPQAVDLLGYTQEAWGTTADLWVEKMHADDVQRVLAENARVNATGEAFFAEYRMHAKDGRVVWIRDEAVLVSDGDDPPRWRGIMLDITAQKEAEEKLRWSLEALRQTVQQRRDLAQRLERAQEEERRRIAADIHDDPIQAMSAVDLRLQMLLGSGTAVTKAELERLHEIVIHSIERLRSLLFELHPTMLDREGLVAALSFLVEHAAIETGWTVEVVNDLEDEPSADEGAILYRIAQEAITNVRKHARASRVTLRVGTIDGGVKIVVEDDGDGFDAISMGEPTPGHLGLTTMVERAELLGGWCRVTSTAGSGTGVECWLPSAVDRE